MIQYKTSNRLFRGLYQYKIVLIVPGASIFRHSNFDYALKQLKSINFQNPEAGSLNYFNAHIKSQDDLDYGFKVHSVLSKLNDVDIRVESPWISIYTNSKSHVNALIKMDETRIKYVCVPPKSGTLHTGVIILPKVDFEFKVTLGKTTHENSAFVDWAEQSDKVKLTKSCAKDMSKDRSFGGSYFYITGEKNLLIAKMHLGGCINKIERIVKA